MAVLRLELEIDSEVHPELYARLASMERLPAREEKLRQLAATGLIWEIDRMHGPAFVEAAAAAVEAAPEPPVTPPARDSVEAGSLAEHAERVPADVPVLHDIVEEVEAVGAQPIVTVAVGLADLPLSRPTAPHPSTGKPRSARMKRMKESGLFQDG